MEMRTVNTGLVEEYAEQMRPLLAVARRAYGNQPQDSIERRYSERVNELLLEYVDGNGGNVTHLAEALDGDISLPGLRRRLRAARGKTRLGEVKAPKGRGSKDPNLVGEYAEKIQIAKATSPSAYGEAVREAYAAGVSITEVGRAMTPSVSYYSLWSAGSNN